MGASVALVVLADQNSVENILVVFDKYLLNRMLVDLYRMDNDTDY